MVKINGMYIVNIVPNKKQMIIKHISNTTKKTIESEIFSYKIRKDIHVKVYKSIFNDTYLKSNTKLPNVRFGIYWNSTKSKSICLSNFILFCNYNTTKIKSYEQLIDNNHECLFSIENILLKSRKVLICDVVPQECIEDYINIMIALTRNESFTTILDNEIQKIQKIQKSIYDESFGRFNLPLINKLEKI